MIKTPEIPLFSATVGATEICPVCGAAPSESGGSCRHCGFCQTPLCSPLPSAQEMAADIMRQLADLRVLDVGRKILVLVADDNLQAELATLAAFPSGIQIGPAGGMGSGFDLLVAGQALARAGDVNQLMAQITVALRPRGLMLAAGPGGRFGGNSLQILLERHGFRLAARPLKWRLLDRSRSRIVARKL